MRPFGPSITGMNKNGSGKEAATCSHEVRSDAVSTLCMHVNVLPALAFAHAGTSETKASQTTSRRDALKKESVPADPDSMICVARCIRAREIRVEYNYSQRPSQSSRGRSSGRGPRWISHRHSDQKA